MAILILLNSVSLEGLGSNLMAELMGILISIGIISFIIEHMRERRWSEVKDVARKDLTMLTNMLRTYFREPLGVRILEQENINYSDKKELEKLQNRLFEEVIQKLDSRVRSMRLEDWQHFKLNLASLRRELNQFFNLYQDRLPPEILGKLLKVNSSFKRVYNSFGLCMDLLTNPEDKWPTFRQGHQQAIAVREVMLRGLIEDLGDLFGDIKELQKIIEEKQF
ncbi:MAG: hypothetical protein ACKKMP_02635 [Candidatus Nealsonbacteria bacterium]